MNVMAKAQAKLPSGANLMLLGEYGSTAHGVSLDNSDHDYLGVAVEPRTAIHGLDNYEHTILKDGAAGEATGAGETEGTVYGLQKFCRLAEQGNTAIMSLLYLPSYTVKNRFGELLLRNRELFRSREVLQRFAGHLTSEANRITGDKAQKVNRPELVAKYGYDTKAAYQAVKLAFHGRRFAREGELRIPFSPEEREYILSIRRGELTPEEILGFLREATSFLDNEAETSNLLPALAPREKINSLLEEIYLGSYGLSPI